MPRDEALEIKVTVAGADPEIWRRLMITDDATLADLHRVFQLTLGWTNRHPHDFTIGDPHDVDADADDGEDDDIFEGEATVAEVLGDSDCGRYEYDFGDDWVHELTVERRGMHAPEEASPPASGEPVLVLERTVS